jgi:hypothetical protein
MTTRLTTRGTTRSTTRGTSPGAAFTLADIPGIAMIYSAAESCLDGSGSPVVDGEVHQVVDLISARNLFPPSAGFRPTRDSDGGPNAISLLGFTADMVKTTASFTDLEDFTVVYMGRIRSTGFTAGERLYSGDGTPAFNHARNALTGTAGTHRISATSGSSGNLSITAGQWMIHIAECIGGAGRTALNDGQFRNMTGSPTEFKIDGFAIGDYAATASLCPDQDIVEIAIFPGPVSIDLHRKIVEYAAGVLGLTVSNFRQYRDTFNRANTSDNDLGLSDTGHAYQIQGSGLANARILDGGWTVISPGAAYTFPQINFIPRTISLDYDIIEYDEDPANTNVSSNVIILTNGQQNLNDMVHLLIGPTGWRLERHYPAGGATVVVEQRASGSFDFPEGSYHVDVNYAAGLIAITDPEGTVTVCDWDDAIPSSPLANYAGEWLCFEIICPTDPKSVMRMTNLYASP